MTSTRFLPLLLSLGLAVPACTSRAPRPLSVSHEPQPLCLALQWRAESLGVRGAGTPTFQASPDLGQVIAVDTLTLLRSPPTRPPRQQGEYFAAQPVPDGLGPYAYWSWEADSLAVYRGDMTWGSRWALAVAGDSVHGWGISASDDGGHWLVRGEGRLLACSSTGTGAT